MRLTDAAALAWRSIASQRSRSFLTLLGIAVGIAAVILLTSIGEGLHRFVLGEFSQFGSHIVSITRGKVSATGGPNPGLPSSVKPLTLDDVAALARVSDVLQASPGVTGNAEAQARGRLRRVIVYGTTAAMQGAFSLQTTAGQFLPDEDAEQARALVVLGSTLKRELFGDSNALGELVRLGGQRFRIVGVLAPRGQFLGTDLDDVAYVPATRALELFNRDSLTEIHVRHRPEADGDRVAAGIRGVLTARHGREDYTAVTQADMLRTLANILDILTLAVGAIGGISLLVGAVGIVTIMTIAVTERTAEIGLLVALGAPPATVLGLFLGEAVVLSALGGALGLAAGYGLVQLLHLVVPALPVNTPLSFVLLAEGGAALIGLLAGVLPARRAARLDPVEALRAS